MCPMLKSWFDKPGMQVYNQTKDFDPTYYDAAVLKQSKYNGSIK